MTNSLPFFSLTSSTCSTHIVIYLSNFFLPSLYFSSSLSPVLLFPFFLWGAHATTPWWYQVYLERISWMKNASYFAGYWERLSLGSVDRPHALPVWEGLCQSLLTFEPSTLMPNIQEKYKNEIVDPMHMLGYHHELGTKTVFSVKALNPRLAPINIIVKKNGVQKIGHSAFFRSCCRIFSMGKRHFPCFKKREVCPIRKVHSAFIKSSVVTGLVLSQLETLCSSNVGIRILRSLAKTCVLRGYEGICELQWNDYPSAQHDFRGCQNYTEGWGHGVSSLPT